MNNRLTHLGETSLVLYKRENAVVYLRVEHNISLLKKDVCARIAAFMQQTDLGDLHKIIDLFPMQESTMNEIWALLGWPKPPKYEELPDTQMAFMIDLQEPSNISSILQVFGKYAADPAMSFTWKDAAILSKYMRAFNENGYIRSQSNRIQE